MREELEKIWREMPESHRQGLKMAADLLGDEVEVLLLKQMSKTNPFESTNEWWQGKGPPASEDKLLDFLKKDIGPKGKGRR